MDPILMAIDEGLKRKGLSDAAASKLAVGHPSLIKNLRMHREGEKRYNVPSLIKLAKVLDLDFYFGPRRDAQPEPPEASPDAFAAIPLYSATLAAGDGSLNDDEAVIDQLAFRRDWLHKIGVSPASAVLARARGDSMSPTIRDSDMVLIDRARAAPPGKVRAPQDRRTPYIYALLDQDGAARVKRLDLAAPGVLAILSDNHEHPPETRPARDVTIIGRVVWWGHTVKE